MQSPRIILEGSEAPDSLSIRLRVRPEAVTTIFLSVWLIGWAAGEIAVVAFMFLVPDGIGPALFMLVWLGFWTWGGIAAISMLAWLLTGYERLTITPDEITLTRGNVFRRWSRRFPTREVFGLHALDEVSPVLTGTSNRRGKVRNRGQGNVPGPKRPWDVGTLRFSHQNDDLGFGIGLWTGEARKLEDMILRHHPELGRKTANP